MRVMNPEWITPEVCAAWWSMHAPAPVDPEARAAVVAFLNSERGAALGDELDLDEVIESVSEASEAEVARVMDHLTAEGQLEVDVTSKLGLESALELFHWAIDEAGTRGSVRSESRLRWSVTTRLPMPKGQKFDHTNSTSLHQAVLLAIDSLVRLKPGAFHYARYLGATSDAV